MSYVRTEFILYTDILSKKLSNALRSPAPATRPRLLAGSEHRGLVGVGFYVKNI